MVLDSFDSFVNHGLALSSNGGTIEFKGSVGDKDILALSVYRDKPTTCYALNKAAFNDNGFFDLNGVKVNGDDNGDTPIISVIGSFKIDVANPSHLKFGGDIFVNNFSVNGNPVLVVMLGAGPNSRISDFTIHLNASTDYPARTNDPAHVDVPVRGGRINLGDSPGILGRGGTGGRSSGNIIIQSQAALVSWWTLKCKPLQEFTKQDAVEPNDPDQNNSLYVIQRQESLQQTAQ
ncbi:MAG: hypothetical protein ACRERU_09525 [Methylococcales bacterium]